MWKAVMLASLRSLIPKVWGVEHEARGRLHEALLTSWELSPPHIIWSHTHTWHTSLRAWLFSVFYWRLLHLACQHGEHHRSLGPGFGTTWSACWNSSLVSSKARNTRFVSLCIAMMGCLWNSRIQLNQISQWEDWRKPVPGQQRAVDRFIRNLSEESIPRLCRDVYRRFFEQAPSGQNYFKQSTTRLYFIASKAGVIGSFVVCGI